MDNNEKDAYYIDWHNNTLNPENTVKQYTTRSLKHVVNSEKDYFLPAWVKECKKELHIRTMSLFKLIYNR